MEGTPVVSAIEASCPACGGAIQFRIGSSIVTVCTYCRSAVARGDRHIEDLGKVAEIVETESPLALGLRGQHEGVRYELVGRSQLAHAAGGTWDEWYVAFADGRWGWLAEAQGRFYLTFEKPNQQPEFVPGFDELDPDDQVFGIPGSVSWTVGEVGEARTIAAAGEIPFRLEPGRSFRYADLAGPAGEFATIDYGNDPPTLYIGRQVSLDELGIPATARAPERAARRVQAIQLSCPHCGGPLELRAPDKSERVTCPNCNSLLDVHQGKLKFFKALAPAAVHPAIPIGATGEFDGTILTVIGFMQRSVQIDGERYFWEEYLLYGPGAGFRWLVCSDQHWSFVQAVSPGEISEAGSSAKYRGKLFKCFQTAEGRVEHVCGEFYWKVAVGECVDMYDFVRPPLMLSKEVSWVVGLDPAKSSAAASVLDSVLSEFAESTGDQLEQPEPPKGKRKKGKGKKRSARTGEVNWSLGTYLPHARLEAIFRLDRLPRSSVVAPNQPFLHRAIYKQWSVLTATVVVVGFLISAISPRRVVLEKSYPLSPPEAGGSPQIAFSEPIDLGGFQNVHVAARSPDAFAMATISGELYHEKTGRLRQFQVLAPSSPMGGYGSGVFLSALPAGKYTLRLEVHPGTNPPLAVVVVRVRQGVPRYAHCVYAMLALAVVPVLVMIGQMAFEHRRWKNSSFGL